MTGKDNISEELRQISGFLATISRITPYVLPDGYFDRLASQVLDRIRDEQSVLKSGLSGPGQMHLPDLNSDSAESAGPDLATLPGSATAVTGFGSGNLPGSATAGVTGFGSGNLPGSATAGPAYSVPEGYFEGFAANLMNRIKAGQQTGALPDKPLATAEDGLQSPREELESLSPILSRIDKKMPFTVPAGYFDELSAGMAAGITGDEKAAIPGNETASPLLAALRNKHVYQVPEGYFAGLPAMVLEKVKSPASAPAKVISLGAGRNWLKYSAAAAVAGLMLTGGWWWAHSSVRTGAGAGSADITKTLPAVSDQDIENYLDTNNVTNNVPLADDFANSTASLDISDNDIKSFLGDVPDGELKQYIDEHGDVKNLATN